MINKIAILAVAMSLASAHAFELKSDGLDQKKLVKKAATFEKKTLTTQACKLYEQAYQMGYQGKPGQEANPRENKTFVQTALVTSECLTDTNLSKHPNQWLKGTIALYELKNAYHVKDITPRLEKIQSDMLDIATIIQDSTNYHFVNPSQDILRACAAAEIGYRIGFLGEPSQAKNPQANDKFVKNGIYHAICVSLLPNKEQAQNPELAHLASYTILKELSLKYDSAKAKQITAPADAIFGAAKRQLNNLPESIAIPEVEYQPPINEAHPEKTVIDEPTIESIEKKPSIFKKLKALIGR